MSDETTEQVQKTVVIGVIGNDPHIIGNRLIHHALTDAGFHVVNLGVQVPPEEFVSAAIETDARAVLVSSLSGFGEVFCRGLRERFVEAGMENILLYVGGNIVMGRIEWSETERIFQDLGFDRIYPPHTRPPVFIDDLCHDLGIGGRDSSPEPDAIGKSGSVHGE